LFNIGKSHLATIMVVVASVALLQNKKSKINLVAVAYGNPPAWGCKK